MTAFDRMKDIVERWGPHREKLLRAISLTGTHDEGDFLLMIFSGRAELITSEKTAVVVEIVNHPKLKSMNVCLLGGDLLDLIAQEPGLEQKARSMGCKRLEFTGRDEWRAAMKDRADGLAGFKVRSEFYKDI